MAYKNRLENNKNLVSYKLYKGQIHGFVTNSKHFPKGLDCLKEIGNAIKKLIKDLRKMKVVIFGGCGFLGSWLVKKLLDYKIKIVIFDYKIKKILNQITNFSEDYVEFVQGDIKNSEQVFNVSNKGDILINLAGLMTPECSKNPIAGNEVNVIGSINVFQQQ